MRRVQLAFEASASRAARWSAGNGAAVVRSQEGIMISSRSGGDAWKISPARRQLSTETSSGSALAEPKKEINGKHLEKIDLRVARIVAARHVEGADRLLQLTLDVGGLASPPPSTDGGGKQGGAAAPSDASQPMANGTAGYRTVFSGIKAAYKPEELVGRLVIYVANLKAWKTPFGLSEGMILAASDPSGSQIFLSATDPGAQPGMIVT